MAAGPVARLAEDLYLLRNFSCDEFYLPSSGQLFDGLGNFGVVLVAIASVLCAATVYLAVDACSSLWAQKETSSYKINGCIVLAVYPLAALCSLAALALPRSQLLSEAITQAGLSIGLYRLFELLVEVGGREATKPPGLALRVGPCCCWPCLPLPTLEMTEVNLARLRLCILQLPVVQVLVYCALLFMAAEAPVYATSYGPYLQPLVVISILSAIFCLNVTTGSFREVAPEAKLTQKKMVAQMVLLFSKLQGALVKGLASTGLFPCNPPLSPDVYANVTYDALMVIEMLMLCYAARLIYAPERPGDNVAGKGSASPEPQPKPRARADP